MSVSLSEIRSRAIRFLGALLVRHLQGWQNAWSSALNEPHLELRVVGLIVGMLVTWALIPAAFNDLGLMSGLSYLLAIYLAFSNATLFRITAVGRDRYIPLGFVAPVFILMGVIGSGVIRPLLDEATNAAVAHDFASAALILSLFIIMSLCFRQLKSGNPY